MSPSAKTLLFLGIFLLSINLLHARAAPKPDDDDDEDDFFKDHHEETSEEKIPAPAPGKPDERSLGGHSPDEHSAHMMNVNQPASSDSEVGKSGFSGGNVSNFNETCDNKACNTDRNLKCDQSKPKPWRCACLDAHTYIRSQEKCYQIRRVEGLKCEFTEQCENGPSGLLSRCNHRSGSCECFDTEMGYRDVILHKNVCVVRRKVNEACDSDAECESTMKSNSVCAPGSSTTWPNATEICQCKKAYVWDNLQMECLKIADKGPGSDCRSVEQCIMSPMGELARCNSESKKCECYDAKNPGVDNVRYFEKTGICYERKAWNSTCSVHDECKASLSLEAECLQAQQQDGYGNMLLQCQCPLGKKCVPLGEGGGAMGIKGINALLIGMLVVYRFGKI